jgi:hypothetical protein
MIRTTNQCRFAAYCGLNSDFELHPKMPTMDIQLKGGQVLKKQVRTQQASPSASYSLRKKDS